VLRFLNRPLAAGVLELSSVSVGNGGKAIMILAGRKRSLNGLSAMLSVSRMRLARRLKRTLKS